MTGGVIEWTGKRRWNPLRGCTRKTEACRHCYAEGMAARFSDIGMPFEGFANWVTNANGKREARWTGKVELIEDRLTLPRRWKKRALCFTDTQSDFFHESLPDEVLDRRMAVMALCPHIHFQVLTKRWGRMREYVSELSDANLQWERLGDAAAVMVGNLGYVAAGERQWPLPNVSLGVSVHDQASANEAIDALLDTSAAIHFVSYEPALGPIHWGPEWLNPPAFLFDKGLDLIIAGDESGAGKRPADPDWYRQTRDQCAAAGTHFFLKQRHINGKLVSCPELDGRQHTDLPQAWRALL